MSYPGPTSIMHLKGGGGVPLKMYFKKNILGCILPFLLVSFQFSRMKITIAAT